MLALVTGGQGFVGSHLCERLTAAGHRVRVLARATSDLSALDGLDVEVVRGDLGADGDLRAAVEGVDWVFHVAGALMGFREEDLLRVNRDGTRRLCEACRAHAPGLSRVVFISSLAAAGPSLGGPATLPEDAPPNPVTWYGRSKLLAEEEVRRSGLPSVILRPPVVFGPRDKEVFKYFDIARRGFLPVPGRTERSYSLIYGPDLAEGILKAAQTPLASGEVIDLTGSEVVTWTELGRRIAAVLGTKDRVVRLPEPLVRFAGRAADIVARLRGRPHIFSSQKVVEMLAPAWVANPRKARELLGWTAPTPLDEALALTVRWYRDEGWF
jgi:nucleoside-diphosphate-sugar epimerase